MKIIEEIKKGVLAHYLTTTLNTVDAIPFYQDHVANDTKYPIIVFKHIASNYNYAMPNVNDSHPNGYNYARSRWRFTIYSNDRQNMNLEDISDRLEDAFHRVLLTFSNGVTHIGTYIVDSRTDFWDQQQKIWMVHQDYVIFAGQ